MNIREALSGNRYPGRGIVLGMSGDGRSARVAYFIMGRSENSRNRVFVKTDASTLMTQAHDPSKMKDPSLIIYAPVRVLGSTMIVTNGDQTDTIRDALLSGGTFEGALRTRTFEPDAPNYTPRISGLVRVENGTARFALSILKSSSGHPDATLRTFFEYDGFSGGEGAMIHTYRCDGNPLPSFEGEPEKVTIKGDIDTFTNEVWESLNEDNKVSLFVRYIDIATGEADTRIVNKNK